MNYMTIRPSGVDSNVVQLFTDEQLFALGNFMAMVVNEHSKHMTSEGRKATSTFIRLLQQWVAETQ